MPFIENDEEITDDKEKAEILNTFFVSVFTNEKVGIGDEIVDCQCLKGETDWDTLEINKEVISKWIGNL